MQTRKPVVAGQFYPAQHNDCIDEINEYLEEVGVSELLPDTIAGAIVPHAGWLFSGKVAAAAFSAIRHRHEKVHCFVIFGAAHSYFGKTPAVYSRGLWNTPLGDIAIDEDLADVVLKTEDAIPNEEAHHHEHSIEVQVPFIQHLFPGAKILPIVVPPNNLSLALGKSVGRIIRGEKQKKIICIGSTDLTHYGPQYGFEVMGIGPEAVKWATEVNDQQFIDLVIKLDAEQMLVSAAENLNACGSGAAAQSFQRSGNSIKPKVFCLPIRTVMR